jgi:SHS2 domain-containing protein
MAEAGRALAEIQLRETGVVAAGEWRPVEVSASDPAGLLADWLNELIYLGETERWVATEFDLDAAGAMLRGRARGVTLGRAPGLVKAATLHGVRVDHVAGGLRGEVILDI